MSIEKNNIEPIINSQHQEKIETKQAEMLDDAWAELSQDWQTQPTQKTDISALIKRTRRRTRGAKFCFALNILATLGLVLAFLYGIFDDQLGDPVNTYIGLGGLISLIFVYFETKLRLATWSQLCDSPEKAIANAIAGSESSMKYMWITKISFLPFLPLVNWFVYTVGQTSEKPLLLAFLMANGFMLGMYAVVEYLHRKRKKEYQQLLQMK
jgi:hypothetical protein